MNDPVSTDAAGLRERVQAQVIRYALELVAEDMANTLMRTARSTVIKEVQDLSCALYDPSGRVIVQSKHAPMLLAGSTLVSAQEGCRRMPTSGTCYGPETYNPQAECRQREQQRQRR